jgi:hypothetical protein
MTATSTETDVSALFDWSVPCDYQEVEMCGSGDSHDADWMLYTKCPGCGLESVRALCDRFLVNLLIYADIGPGVNCRECKTFFDRDMLKPEPLKRS